MFKFRTKKLEVPENNETKEVEAIQLWYVKMEEFRSPG